MLLEVCYELVIGIVLPHTTVEWTISCEDCLTLWIDSENY